MKAENTLLLILSEGHSHSLQFRPAACLAFPQQIGTHTHTQKKTLKMNINTRLAHSDPQLTQSKCENIKKRETKRSNLPFQLFLAVYTQAWQIVCANCRWKETAVEMLSPLLSQCLSSVVSFKTPDICSNVFAPCRFLRSCTVTNILVLQFMNVM